MRSRGYIDHKVTVAVIVLMLAVLLWDRIPGAWLWIAAGAAGALLLVLIALAARRAEPQVEEVDGRKFVHFDGRRIAADGAPLEAVRWTSGGAFGQPLETRMTLKRSGQVVYEGREADAERLLAFLAQLER